MDSYFTRVIEIKDQLGNVGEEIPNKELYIYILRGLQNASESFVQSVIGHDNLPKYDHLCAYCVEEEARIMAKSGETHEENQVLQLIGKGRRGGIFLKGIKEKD